MTVKNTIAGSMVVLSLATVGACTSSSNPKTSATPGATTDDAGSSFPASPTTWSMKATVPASSEVFKCQYVTMPASAGFVVAANSQYTVGSHHLLVYTTDLASIPAGETAMGDCYEGTSGAAPDFMNHIRGVIYGAQSPTYSMTMPAGIGIPYAASAVLMFQVHYLNATGADFQAEADVHLGTQASGITTNAGVLFFYDPFIDVPIGAMAKASWRCPIPQDITILGATSHYHARGNGYQAYLDPPSGSPATTPFYTSNNWASPGIMSTSVSVPAGSHIRYYCDYDNTLGNEEYFQGPSAADNEMCMFMGLYYPAMAQSDEECLGGDTFGTGTTSCMDTVTCLEACPVNDAGADGIDFNSCIQKCNVASCPNAGGPLAGYLDCFQASCQSQCAGSTTANPSSACSDCVEANCASQYLACSGLTGCD